MAKNIYLNKKKFLGPIGNQNHTLIVFGLTEYIEKDNPLRYVAALITLGGHIHYVCVYKVSRYILKC